MVFDTAGGLQWDRERTILVHMRPGGSRERMTKAWNAYEDTA